MRLAIYQGPSPKGALGDGLGTIDRMLTAAAAAGARLAVFPEVYLPGYNVKDPRLAAKPIRDWVGLLTRWCSGQAAGW